MGAAISAARRGRSVALIQDRPVLGGNASSEIRMHACGAHGENNRETGIIEELKLENRYRNPLGNYSIWDSILFEKVRFEPNILLLLNCSVCDAKIESGREPDYGPEGENADTPGDGSTTHSRIKSVTGWQLTTYTWHTVEATLFADCSGDSILAPLSGAEYRVGRESREEHDESIAPEQKDKRTMGMSCLIQARETSEAHQFIPPVWAYRYDEDGELPERDHHLAGDQNFWWLEVGGMQDSIHDTEDLRDELIKIAFGVWDHIKNRGDHAAENWVLDWVGFLPGKRESRRYVGDHVLTQKDVEAEGRHFDDIVAYGGWTMDDHFPEGFYKKEAGTIWHPAPSPYGIPYRSFYSRNIENLMFAGRNISATHTALSSTRVMATCSVIGQAVGTAAALSLDLGLTPRGVYREALSDLKLRLMEDDAYLPFTTRELCKPTREAHITTSDGESAEVLRNGIDRPVDGVDNGYYCEKGGWIEFSFDEPRTIEEIRFVFDSDLRNERDGRMVSYYEPAADEGKTTRVTPVPESMTREYRIEIQTGTDRRIHIEEKNNYQRLRRHRIGSEIQAVRFVPVETWGTERAHLFAIDLL